MKRHPLQGTCRVCPLRANAYNIASFEPMKVIDVVPKVTIPMGDGSPGAKRYV